MRTLETPNHKLLTQPAIADAPSIGPGFLSPDVVSRLRKVLCLVVCWQTFAAQACWAMPPTTEQQQIDSLSNQILQSEIDLERYYLQYRVHGTKQPRWRRVRFFLLQTASAACTLASNITFIKLARDAGTENDFGFADPHRQNDIEGNTNGLAQASQEKNSNPLVRKGIVAGLIGTLLDGGSSFVEMGSSTFTAYKNSKTGRSPNVAVTNVVARIKNIDALLTQRSAVVLAHPELQTDSICKAEGRVLKGFRDWCLSEFADVYATVKSTDESSNVYYLLDVVADSLYVAGFILALRSFAPSKENLTGPAVINSIVGDAFTIISAPASYYSYNLLYKYWRKRLRNKLKESLDSSEAESKEAMVRLNRELASSDAETLEASGSVQNRASVYALWSARHDKILDKQIFAIKQDTKTALQDEISGPAIGATYMAQEVTAAVAVYGVPTRPKAGANLALSGAISSSAGSAGSLGLTNLFFIDQQIQLHKLRKKGLLPEQLLAERLNALDDLDQMLKAPNKTAH